ncbi:Gfo/Idh/MocA family oxidoreductase [Pedobacter sp. SL55]|uniref:Gfo/Idh/MocA family oxidoreductase n=1 Tax=Pedobacter sp. SL55 TaxID=2995161 RepID=UPI00226DE832|nr:Gfo/Idh/MocA family oxidoreductase [Pedobacter sp. SL55]WAC42029.1 Gfo/Idh/MocA family oxidoreductase [Pedobacter sp. SL55]
MSSKINVGLMAYGMSGKVFHAPFVHLNDGFNFVAVTERSKKQAAQDYPDVISYDTIDELIADENIDLVIINTPNYTHYDYAKKCLLAGKHILVDKPFTATVAQAKELFALAKEVGKKALVYQNRRFDSGFKIAKEIIESGKLGKLTEVHFRFDRYRNEIGPKGFKEDPSFEASGLSYDLGPHLIDQAVALFGKPDRFYKVLANNREGSKVDDYFFIHLAYANQLNVYLTATLLAADIPPAFVVNGSLGAFSKNHGDVQESQLLKGMKPSDEGYGIEVAEDAGKLTLVNADGGRDITTLKSPQGNYGEIFELVYQAIINDQPYPITEEDIIAQLEILES